MTTKLGRMVAHLDGLLSIKLHNLLTIWSCKITWRAKKFISSLAQCLWPRNLLRWYGDLFWRASNHKVTQRPDHVIFLSHVTNKNHYISTTRMRIATKLCRMVAHLDRLLLTKSHEYLITKTYEITRQAKAIISPLSQCLWPRNLVGRWLLFNH